MSYHVLRCIEIKEEGMSSSFDVSYLITHFGDALFLVLVSGRSMVLTVYCGLPGLVFFFFMECGYRDHHDISTRLYILSQSVCYIIPTNITFSRKKHTTNTVLRKVECLQER